MWRILPRKDRGGDKHTVYQLHISIWDFSDDEKYVNSQVLGGRRNCSEVTWMALEMFPLYMKTNQADGENYYCLWGVGWGRKGRR